MYMFTPATTDLKPERMMNYELAYAQRLGKRAHIGANIFYIKGDNLINTVRVGGRPRNVNTGSFKNWGLELSADYIINKYWSVNGNYSFQYAKNVEIRNAVINSKDAFWESENVTLVDCEVNGEYLGWYAKNMRLVRCHLTGEQLLCYVDGLILENCTFGEDANLMFEYSTVNATINGDVTSIKNPTSGTITINGKCGEVIFDKNQKAPADAKLIIKK